MASFEFITFDTGTLKQKRRPSSAMQLDVSSVRVGASNLEIKETSSHFDFSAKRLTNLAAPSSGSDAVTLTYLQAQIASVAAGFDPKASVQLATVAALAAVTAAGSGVGKTLTADANGALSIDGTSATNGMRVLVKNQVSAINNGIYDVTDAGSAGTPFILTRATDFDGSPAGEVTDGAYMLVTGGATLIGSNWYLVATTDPTVDTDALNFSQASMPNSITASTGLEKVGNDIRAKLEASNPSLQVSSTELGVKLGHGITKDANGTTVNLDGGTLAKSSSGLKVASSGISANELASDSVITAKILDSNVVTSKLADAAVTQVKRDWSSTVTNDNAGSITVRQFVYRKSNGAVDLAIATGAYDEATEFGIVQATTIATTASGLVIFEKGYVMGGFSGLTVGAPVFLSRTTAGGYQQDLSGFVATNQVVRLGFAESATTVRFDPEYKFEY